MRYLVLGLAALGLWPSVGSNPGWSAPDVAPRAAQLGWLAGCWERLSGPRLVEEQWTRPRGGLMLGVGRTVQGDSLVEYEQVRVFERGGKLVYAAQPSGQAPAEFTSTAVSDSSVVFENLGHDFPQRVMYQRLGADSLLARIEGVRHGQLHGVNFPYVRVACP